MKTRNRFLGCVFAVMVTSGLLATSSAQAEEANGLLNSAAMTQFAERYAQLVLDPQKNNAFSPLSLYEALMMAAYGAREVTQKELLKVLYGTIVAEISGPVLKYGYQRAEDSEGFTIANAVMIDKSLPYRQSYVEKIETRLGAKFFAMNFAAGGSEDQVNSWFSKKTGGNIPSLFDKLPPETKMILANALHFKSSWAVPFNEAATEKGEFHVMHGGVFPVNYMNTIRKMNYLEVDGWQLAQLNTENKDIDVIFGLPPADKPAPTDKSVQNILSKKLGGNDRLHEWLSGEGFESRKVHLSLPKFSLDMGGSIRETLKATGLSSMFTDWANFDGITSDPEQGIKTSDVVHKVTFEIDEEGVEASAVTTIVGSSRMMEITKPVEIIRMDVNRPFFAWVANRKTGVPIIYAYIAKPDVAE